MKEEFWIFGAKIICLLLIYKALKYKKLNNVIKLFDLNRQLYNFAKNNNVDVIGLKDDLEDLIC